METCPICRATLNGASICRRCRADLQKVQEIEQLGQALAGAAMRCVAERDLDAAEHWLRRAQAVHATPAVQVLARLMAKPRLRREGDSLSAAGGGEGRGEVGDAPLHIGAVTPRRAYENGSLP